MFSPDFIAIIDLLGAVHGLFLAKLLVSRRHNTFANRILSLVMVAFAVDLLSAAYFAKGYQMTHPHFMGVDYLLPLLYGPIIYLYARVVSSGAQSLNFRHWLHFVPLGLVFLYMVPFYMQTGAEKLALFLEPATHPWTSTLDVINTFKTFYSLGYLLAIFVLLRRHRKNLKHNFSSLDKINLVWLQRVLVGGLITWVISFFFQFFWSASPEQVVQDPLSRNVSYVSIAVACFVYAIGYLGLRQPEIFTSAGSPKAREPGVAGDVPRYARSGMDETRATELKRRLIASMEEEKLYRQNSLTLKELADVLETSPHNISEVLNTQIAKTFHDFVNGYRVEEVQHRLADPANDTFTLLSIGLDAGFNSKSSYNAVFKKHTGMTPSQFKVKVKSQKLKQS